MASSPIILSTPLCSSLPFPFRTAQLPRSLFPITNAIKCCISISFIALHTAYTRGNGLAKPTHRAPYPSFSDAYRHRHWHVLTCGHVGPSSSCATSVQRELQEGKTKHHWSQPHHVGVQYEPVGDEKPPCCVCRVVTIVAQRGISCRPNHSEDRDHA